MGFPDGSVKLSDHPQPGTGGVFGRRAGRRLRAGQTHLVAEMLPRFEINLDAARTPFAAFSHCSELRLEIGFGGGEHLIDHALRRPDAGFIGCEPFRNGVAKLLEHIRSAEAFNIRLFIGDAGALIDQLPAGCLAGVDIFYPDPWPKRRQRKRRFLSDDTLRRIARVLAEGACLRFATDIDDYAGWCLARVLRSKDFAWDAVASDDWSCPWPDWPSTRYEAKAFSEGRRPVYLTFRRVLEASVPASRPSPPAGTGQS